MIKNIEALQESVLKDINGGVLNKNTDLIAENTVAIFKQWNMSFEDFRNLVIKKYNEDPMNYSTTGSAEDLEEYLQKVEAIWFRPEK